jgi:hypothetical protein
MKEKLLTDFTYRDGNLYWNVNRSRMKVGDLAGAIDNKGYRVVSWNSKSYKVHRLIFMMFYGYVPKFIDHIDADPSNNRIENLRPTTTSQNLCNTRIRVNNTSGVKGVSWHKPTSKWQVKISIDGKDTHLGLYDSIDQAKQIADAARVKHHGDFARHA